MSTLVPYVRWKIVLVYIKLKSGFSQLFWTSIRQFLNQLTHNLKTFACNSSKRYFHFLYYTKLFLLILDFSNTYSINNLLFNLPKYKLRVEQAGVFLSKLNGNIEKSLPRILRSFDSRRFSLLAFSAKGVYRIFTPVVIKNDKIFILIKMKNPKKYVFL